MFHLPKSPISPGKEPCFSRKIVLCHPRKRPITRVKKPFTIRERVLCHLRKSPMTPTYVTFEKAQYHLGKSPISPAKKSCLIRQKKPMSRAKKTCIICERALYLSYLCWKEPYITCKKRLICIHIGFF